MLCSFFLFQILKYCALTTINPQAQCPGKERKKILRHYLFGDNIMDNWLKIDTTQ